MAPSLTGPSGPSHLVLATESLSVVRSAVALEDVAQGEGMGRMGQPEQGGDVELLYSLTGDAEGPTDLGEGLGGVTVEAIVGDDDLGQAWGEPGDEAVQFGLQLGALETGSHIGKLASRG